MKIDRSVPIPIYHQIKTGLVKQIDVGELNPGDKLPSEIEMAGIIDVSPMTVRQAYRELEEDGVLSRRQGKGTFIAPRGASIPLKKSGMDIGVLIKSLDAASLFSSELCRSIEFCCHQCSYSFHVLSANNRPLADQGNFLLNTILANRHIDGIITMGYLDIDDLRYLSSLDIPFVCIDDDHDEPSPPTVLLDDGDFTRSCVAAAINLGKPRVAMMCGDLGGKGNARRRGDRMIAGYEGAFKAAGLKVPTGLIFPSNSIESALAAARMIVSLDPPPDLVVVNGDANTRALETVATTAGIDIPGAMPVVNYGDSALSPFCPVPKPLDAMGETAFDMLRRLVKKLPVNNSRVIIPVPPPQKHVQALLERDYNEKG